MKPTKIKIYDKGVERTNASSNHDLRVSSSRRRPVGSVYTFWHNRVFLATYFWQKRRIVVMTSQSFDGEYIARFIQRFGYGAARGSSTRGAVGAIIEMIRLMRAGAPTAFPSTARKVHPTSPRWARCAGQEDRTTNTSLHNHRATLGSETKLGRLPGPLAFFPCCVDIAPPIYVSADSTDEGLEAKRNELQAALDEINQRRQ